MRPAYPLWIAILLLVCGLPAPASPEGGDRALVVGVKVSPPFVFQDAQSGALSGFSIDLMRALVAEFDPVPAIEFVVQSDIAAHLDAVAAADVDVGIAATTISSDRERRVDFSQPFYQGGLAIVVPSQGQGSSLWQILLSSELLWTLLWLSLFILVCSHLIWFAERGSDAFSDSWRAGVGQGIWWTIVTMSTVGYGDFAPKKPLSRVLGVVVIFAGIIAFGVAVASFSSVLTLHRLASDITGPEDLRDRIVSVVRNSVGPAEVARRGAQVLLCDDLDTALAAVRQGRAAAAVHDEPLLRHSLLRSSGADLALVGAVFAERGYGICFPPGSGLREEVDVILLGMLESEASPYRALVERWFGGG